MAENKQSATPKEGQMAIQHVYLKDCSFEAPNVLALDQSGGEPNIEVGIAQRSEKLEDNRYHVALSLTVTSKQGENTAFLCEVEFAGFFQINDFDERQLSYVINVLCPNVLYPYCRAQVGALVSSGGFFLPPLQVVNFEGVFRQRLEEAQQQAEQAPAESGPQH